MKRRLITAFVAVMVMAVFAVPASAMVGAKKPEDPNKMVITSLQPVESNDEERKVSPLPEKKAPKGDLIKAPEEKSGDKRWYIMNRRAERPEQYQVQKGDTLWKITEKVYNVRNPIKVINLIGQLIDLNGDIIDPDLIYVGQTIELS